ncbi:MAG TPA: hypothetical protein VGE76_14375 [Opitutaceae bacterium]
MLRLSLALLCVTTTASAAMPFELPPVTIPSPQIVEWRLPPQGRPWNSMPTLWVPPLMLGFCGGVFYIDDLPCNVLGLIELYGSEARYRTALETTHIEVVHLAPRFPDAKKPGDYLERDPVALDEVQINLLKHALTADAGYKWDLEQEIIELDPLYDLRIRLRHGEKTLTADLSLSARTIRVVDNNAIVAEQPLSEYGYALLTFLAELADARE